MRAAIYVRVAHTADAHHAAERQSDDCIALATGRGYTVVKTFTDIGSPASLNVRRPGYEALLDAAEDRQIDVIVTWSLDRLLRHPAALEHLLDACDRDAVRVETVRPGMPDLSTAEGRLQVRILAAVAEHDAERARRRKERGK